MDQVEMPKYKSHKEVWAVRIKDIIEIFEDGSVTIVPEEPEISSFRTREDWVYRFNRKGGDFGYYVVYEDGFTSWSPTDAFESGYTRIAK